jgi:uncharacterized protein YkwD
MRMKTLLLLITCAFTITWWPRHPKRSEPETPMMADTATARVVLDAVNTLRASGCRCPGGKRFPPAPALRLDAQLETAAQAHAEDMNKRRYFSHESRDGSDSSDRISRAGYKWRLSGENIAMGHPTAEAVVKGWRNSKGHCHNLMHPGYRDMGIGKAGPYWVQNLGARAE